jgi:kynurenine 3-monooxygenase
MIDQEKAKNYHICIVGAGLAGSMAACLLSKLGFQISIYEKRNDPRNDNDVINDEFGRSTSSLKRSINLAISHRGFCALKEIDLYKEVMEEVIRMPCRVIHNIDNTITIQSYCNDNGNDNEAIYSISRQYLNFLLLNQLSKNSNNHHSINFDHTLISISKTGLCTFVSPKGEINQKFDLILGADGAYSAVRECMLKQGRIDFNRKYIKHGYKELSIPPKVIKNKDNDDTYEYALDNFNGLHIWPRGEFMLIALPNPDKSFTATLFAPYHGKDGFDSITMNDDDINK